MREAVRNAFYDFNVAFEADIPYFYQDVLGLVSIGVGILCDPIQLGLGLNLPMVHPDGTPATRNDIAAEWTKIKALGSGTYLEGNPAAINGHLFAKRHTRLRLTSEGLRSSLAGKLHQNDLILRQRFPDFETWCADAQLAIHSLAWGCGPAFRFPKLEAALKALDFTTASGEVRMVANGVELNGLKPRNRANKILLLNAAYVHGAHLDPDALFYPTDLTAEPVDKDADTQPELVPVVRPDPIEAKTVVDWEIVHKSPFDDEPPPDDAA
jgi:hypothetical protein